MYKMLNYIKKNIIFISIISLLIIVIVILIFRLIGNKQENIIKTDNVIAYEEKIQNDNNDIKEYVNVDIKGAIKKKGIYSVEKGSTISDVIKVSGGLLKNATTIDINLSKQVYNEMVIYISNKSEYNNRYNNIKCGSDNNDQSKEIASKDIFVSDYNNTTANKKLLPENNQTVDNNNQLNKKININSASLDEIQKIPGIGESKAEKIIAYRKENGLFKSIEDIKNVSGIGDSIYEKIKDYIAI